MLPVSIATQSSSVFNPLKIPGTKIWLDASDLSTITSSSNLISQWSDKSGNNNHFVQAITAKQPTLSGSSVVLGASGAYHLQNTSFALNANTLSGFVVVEQTGRGSGTNVYARFLSFSASTGNDYDNTNSVILTDNNPAAQFQVYRSSASIVGLSQPTLNTKTVLGFIINGTSATIYKNLSTASGTTSATALNITRTRIGADPVEVDSNLYGKYYEVLVYNQAISSTDASQLITSLMNKWSIS